MKLTLIRTLVGSSLLLAACMLSACGKTGALYLPDAGPAATTKPDTSPSPGKTQ